MNGSLIMSSWHLIKWWRKYQFLRSWQNGFFTLTVSYGQFWSKFVFLSIKNIELSTGSVFSVTQLWSKVEQQNKQHSLGSAGQPSFDGTSPVVLLIRKTSWSILNLPEMGCMLYVGIIPSYFTLVWSIYSLHRSRCTRGRCQVCKIRMKMTNCWSRTSSNAAFRRYLEFFWATTATWWITCWGLPKEPY